MEQRASRPRPAEKIEPVRVPPRSPLVGYDFVARWLLVFILAAGVYFFHGFVVPVLAALVIGFASWPLYKRLRTSLGGRNTLAATLALVLVLSSSSSYPSSSRRSMRSRKSASGRPGRSMPTALARQYRCGSPTFRLSVPGRRSSGNAISDIPAVSANSSRPLADRTSANTTAAFLSSGPRRSRRY